MQWQVLFLTWSQKHSKSCQAEYTVSLGMSAAELKHFFKWLTDFYLKTVILKGERRGTKEPRSVFREARKTLFLLSFGHTSSVGGRKTL